MWVRKRLDIAWGDLAMGVTQCGLPISRAELQTRLEDLWSDSRHALACLSVRSGLDLLLATLQWPPGSEVLMSAMTIPDMARIVQQHGLVPIPVDLDVATLGPHLESLRAAISPAARALIVAHLCGGRSPMEPILALARQHRLMVIEDCAQAFDGLGYTGHPEADVSMFSFGSIKTATALGGAMLRVKDGELLAKMRARQAQYPIQTRRDYLRRLLKYAAFKALSARPIYGLLVRTWVALGRDYDRLVNGSVRGFPGPAFFDRIRQQPATPLLALLLRRLRTYNGQRLACRAAKGRLLTQLLQHQVVCAGAAMDPHNYWVFPILVDNPAEVIAALRRAGFDATQGHSMCVVAPPRDRPALAPTQAEHTLSRIVYLPIYPEMPEHALRRMAQTVLDVAKRPLGSTVSPLAAQAACAAPTPSPAHPSR